MNITGFFFFSAIIIGTIAKIYSVERYFCYFIG